MIKSLIIFSLILILNLEGRSQCDLPFYHKYISKGDSVLKIIKAKKGGTADDYKAAINHFNTAMLVCPDSAEHARSKILEVFKEIQKLKQLADNEKNDADQQREKAESATYRFKVSTFANAPYKYIRLIRDGPEDVEKIRNESFDSKLIAYCYHLDILGDSIRKYCDSISPDYNVLMDKLYYDNDLYEKIYYCLKSLNPEDTVALKPFKGKRPDFGLKKFTEGDKIYTVEFENRQIKTTRNGVEEILVPPSDHQFISFTLSRTSKRLFCATDDNYIFVYSFCDSIKPMLLKDETIAMGSKITALDFKEDSSIIFFGTVKGDIGFIRYNSDRKNQPVYDVENSLGSEITSVGFFTHKIEKDSLRTFLLATSLKNRSAVYELNSNYLTPNYKFSGNALPRRGLGNINHAVFDSDCQKVIIETKKDDAKGPSLWEWNPFSREILEGLKVVITAKLKSNENQVPAEQILNKSKVKFY